MEWDESRLTLKIHVARLQKLDTSWNTECFKQPYRVIPYARLYLPVRGSGEIVLKNIRLRLIPGRLFLVPPFVRIHVCCSESLQKFWCHFNAFRMDTGLDYFSLFDHCLEREVEDPPFYEKLFRLLTDSCALEDARLAPGDRLRTRAALNLLLAPFLDEKPDRTGKNLDRLVKLLNFIEKNLDSRLDGRRLAAVCALNPTYLTNLFKAQTGIPLMQYVSRRRLSKGAEYLVHSDYSLSEIAEKIGLGSLEQFSRNFKALYGVSPHEWRKDRDRYSVF